MKLYDIQISKQMFTFFVFLCILKMVRFMESYIIKTYQDGSQVTVRDVQKVILEIAKVVDQICEKHHIPYIVNGGTALGVIRHQGFIPWDDDFDMAILRKDYKRFIKALQEDLPEDYTFHCFETDQRYNVTLPAMKIRKKNTYLKERNLLLPNKCDDCDGVFIDVFLYNYVSENKFIDYPFRFVNKYLLMPIIVLLENLPQFIQAGIQMTIGLMNGLINAIPVLLESLPQIISSIISGLMGAIPQLIMLGPQLIVGLITGLLNALPSLITLGPKLVLGIVDGIINGISNMVNVGKNLVKGLWNGITGSLDWIKKKIKGWVGNVLDFIKGLFGIHSPSTEFAYFGRMNVLGLEEGMEDMEGSLNATIGDMVNLSPSLLASASNSYNPNVNVVVNNQFEQDPLGQMVQRRKTFASGAKNDYNFGMGV